jgi:peptidyl-prolyl cis-trans isomerase SurA
MLLVGAKTSHAMVIDRIVAIVNQDIITLSELQKAALVASTQQESGTSQNNPNPFNPESMRTLLKSIIEKKLQLQEAQKKGVSLSPDELQTALAEIKRKNDFADDEALERALAEEHLSLEQYKNDLKEQLTLLKLINREIKAGIILEENDLKSYYEEHKERFKLPDRARIRQILLKLPEGAADDLVNKKKKLAGEIVARIRAGGDFKEMVRQYSEGPERSRDGDLGLFRPGELLAPLNDVAFSLSTGDVSPPLRTPLGFHILRIEEKETNSYKPFEAAKEEIRESLAQIKTEEFHQKWLMDLRIHSYVEIKL